MKQHKQLFSRVEKQKILPLFYCDDLHTSVSVTKTLYQSGIKCIEYTNRGKNALSNLKAIIAERNINMPDLLVAAGTIQSIQDVFDFKNAGADFLVSPFFDSGISKECIANDILLIPGCLTPSEIHAARSHGHSFIKLFPGNLLQPAYLKSIRDLFPDTRFLVTGGVESTAEGINSWLAAGAAAVGLGSTLVSSEIIENKGYEQLAFKTNLLLAAILNSESDSHRSTDRVLN